MGKKAKKAKKSRQAKRIDSLLKQLVELLRSPEFLGKVTTAEVVGLLTCLAMDINTNDGRIEDYNYEI